MRTKERVHTTASSGFTLVEIIVSFAILAIVSVSLIAAVAGLSGVLQRDAQMRADNSVIEGEIASSADPSQSEAGIALPLGSYTLPGTSDTYSIGIGTYTVLNAGAGATPDVVELDGDRYHAATYSIVKTGYYEIEVWGASGGGNGYGAGAGNGGGGGYATGIVRLERGTVLYLHAGGEGQTKTLGGTNNGGGAGGYNGGGQGGWFDSVVYVNGGGGGASDVRIDSDSLVARVIVAGGGGGAGGGSTQDNIFDLGGAGGGSVGADGQALFAHYGGSGGSQSSGGMAAADQGDALADDGTFGTGGSCLVEGRTGGGGGGGWYGGGGGSFGGGGGGSGWAFTEAAYNAWSDSSERDSYLLTSAHWLLDTRLVSGNAPMPDPRNNGASMSGMRGNGYVRVSWVGVIHE